MLVLSGSNSGVKKKLGDKNSLDYIFTYWAGNEITLKLTVLANLKVLFPVISMHALLVLAELQKLQKLPGCFLPLSK